MTQEQWENTTKLLKDLAKPDCVRCYGRGYIGKEIKRDVLVPCMCVSREKLKNKILNSSKIIKPGG